MNSKIRVGVLFGGKSSEHEVSLLSAKNVIAGLDRSKYEVVLLGIDKQGGWHLQDEADYLLNGQDPKQIALKNSDSIINIVPSQTSAPIQLDSALSNQNKIGALDVVIPVLHGPNGEDGTVQGLLKLLDIPFVGAGILGSSIGMDKDIMKRLLRDAGLPIGKFITLYRESKSFLTYEEAAAEVGDIIFVKPANAGSSVGVSKVKNKSDYQMAVTEAFRWDRKILLEQFIPGREIECAVLGNFEPIASIPGEIIPTHEFYSYEAKYLDENGAKAEIPANLPKEVVKKVQELAIQTFKTLQCEGLGRVDVFVNSSFEIYINEINTLPGFTNISMYPKLWEASGIGYTELLDRLIGLALSRNEEEKRSVTSFKYSSK